MKIINKNYTALSGFIDIAPVITTVSIEQVEDEDGNVLISHAPNPHVFFNEVQVDGDSNYRRKMLEDAGIDHSEILFLDDPNYEKLALRRRAYATKDMSLRTLDKTVREKQKSLEGQEPKILNVDGEIVALK